MTLIAVCVYGIHFSLLLWVLAFRFKRKCWKFSISSTVLTACSLIVTIFGLIEAAFIETCSDSTSDCYWVGIPIHVLAFIAIPTTPVTCISTKNDFKNASNR